MTSYRLNSLTIDLSATVTGQISGAFQKGATKSYSFNLVHYQAPAINIPTPIPGLTIAVIASGSIDCSATASFNIAGSLGSASASATVGTNYNYLPSSGWSHTPTNSFTWSITPPSLTDVSASLALTITPSLTLELGGGILILDIAGGPQFGVPLTFTLAAQLVGGGCKLQLTGTWGVTVSIDASISLAGSTLVSGSIGPYTIASGNIFSPICLISKKKYKKRKTVIEE